MTKDEDEDEEKTKVIKKKPHLGGQYAGEEKNDYICFFSLCEQIIDFHRKFCSFIDDLKY